MKKTVLALAILAASTAASAQISFTISDTGYGRITLGESVQPDVVYQEPRTVYQTYQNYEPVYVRVPVQQQQNWSRYCASYNLCNRPVYFVQESWYQSETRNNDDFEERREEARAEARAERRRLQEEAREARENRKDYRRDERYGHRDEVDYKTRWVHAANEGQSFTLNGTATVRYGANGKFVQKNVTNAGACTNAFFGSDPAPNVRKECDVLTRDNHDSRHDDYRTRWVFEANEGQSFTLNGTATVRYGANGKFVQKNVTNAGACTNAFFGRDPAPNVRKQCDVLTRYTRSN